MSKTFIIILFLVCTLGLSASAQVAPQSATLLPGQSVERQIAGGESHNYQIRLAAGQFMRVVVEQKGVDVSVAFVAPDNKQVDEADFTGAFGEESISHQATLNGGYQIVVRATAAKVTKGIYEVRLEVKDTATAKDKQRIGAERLLAEAKKLNEQKTVTAAQTIEKAQLALSVFRAIGDRYWEAQVLNLIGNAYDDGKFDQAVESYDQEPHAQRG
jgi:hypothetical protein